MRYLLVLFDCLYMEGILVYPAEGCNCSFIR